MHKWYVKAVRQSLAQAQVRASLLGCTGVLESTSSQVDAVTPLPHVIVQTRLGVNRVYPEPVSRFDLDAVFDEPLTPQELASTARQTNRDNASARVRQFDLATVIDPAARALLSDLVTAAGFGI
jgi:TPR repeat protein